MNQTGNVSSNPGPSRPAPSLWMLAILAFGLGPLLSRLLFDTQLAAANTWLIAAMDIHARDEIHHMRQLLRVVLPTLLTLALLRFTALGGWIVMTPLILSLLIVENMLHLVHELSELSPYVLNGNSLLRAFMKGPAQPIAVGCIVSAVLLTVCTTAWHRSFAFKRWLTLCAR